MLVFARKLNERIVYELVRAPECDPPAAEARSEERFTYLGSVEPTRLQFSKVRLGSEMTSVVIIDGKAYRIGVHREEVYRNLLQERQQPPEAPAA